MAHSFEYVIELANKCIEQCQLTIAHCKEVLNDCMINPEQCKEKAHSESEADYDAIQACDKLLNVLNEHLHECSFEECTIVLQECITSCKACIDTCQQCRDACSKEPIRGCGELSSQCMQACHTCIESCRKVIAFGRHFEDILP